MTPAVYVQTNDASDNEIVAFSRSEEGQLAPLAATARVVAERESRTCPPRTQS